MDSVDTVDFFYNIIIHISAEMLHTFKVHNFMFRRDALEEFHADIVHLNKIIPTCNITVYIECCNNYMPI